MKGHQAVLAGLFALLMLSGCSNGKENLRHACHLGHLERIDGQTYTGRISDIHITDYINSFTIMGEEFCDVSNLQTKSPIDKFSEFDDITITYNKKDAAWEVKSSWSLGSFVKLLPWLFLLLPALVLLFKKFRK